MIWKNYRLKKWKQLLLILEIVIPLFIIFLIVFVKIAVGNDKVNHCHLKEKSLLSLGIIQFVRDLFCSFTTRCHSSNQLNWKYNYSNFIIRLLNNLTDIYNESPNEPVDWFNVWIWSWKKRRVIKLKAVVANLKWIVVQTKDLYDKIKSRNQSEFVDGITKLKTIFCGFSRNDLHFLLDNLQPINTINKNHNESKILNCKEFLSNSLSGDLIKNEIYKIIAPLIFGKIYYTPNSEITREIIKRANRTFVIIDNIRWAAKEWRIKYQYKLAYAFKYNKYINAYKKIAELCIYWKISMMEDCKLFLDYSKEKYVQLAIDSVSKLFFEIEKILNCMVVDKFVPLNSVAEMDNLEKRSMIDTFAGIVFHESFQHLTLNNAKLLRYKIRIPSNRIDVTRNYKVLDDFWTPNSRLNTFIHLKYYINGFLFLQEAIDEAFIEIITNQTVGIGSTIQIMPYPCYIDDKFINYAPNILPFIFVVGWAPSFMILLQNIVYEKEIRLKEFLRIMSLSSRVNWFGWFFITFLFLLIPITVISIALKFSNLFSYSSFSVIFLLMLSYVVSLICQVFMISVFFDNANIAALTGGILYFILYSPFLLTVNSSENSNAKPFVGFRFFSQVLFCNSIKLIIYWEQSKNGIQFENLFENIHRGIDFGVGHSIVLMWLNSVIYLFITWYIGTVFPGTYGITKPWYFLFSCHYWYSVWKRFGKEISMLNLKYSSESLSGSSLAFIFKDMLKELKICIKIENLSLQYSKDGPFVIDKLDLEFYESEITTILGPSGSGKTSIVSVLSGIFSPTSGTVYMMGKDIRYEMEKIRKRLGFCPQYSILFSYLSVRDHFYFYSYLKGLTSREIELYLPKMLLESNLTSAEHTLSMHLSYGMKRKLSVAISFIGNSKIVILDEPTVGIDPYARKQIWNVLLKYRAENRTIILITQDMEEADHLSDRVAVLFNGKLKCFGSSEVLKKQYGYELKLFLYRSKFTESNDDKSFDISLDGIEVLKHVTKIITDAQMKEETDTRWTIILPQNTRNSELFSQLFLSLESFQSKLKISGFGLSDTSIEDVFIKSIGDLSKLRSNYRYYQEKNYDITNYFNNYYNYLKYGSLLHLKEKSIMSEMDSENFHSLEMILKFDLLVKFSKFRQQILGMLIKRFNYTKRNYIGFMAEVLLPSVLIILMIIFSMFSTFLNDQPTMVINPWLMMENRTINLNTFFSKENYSNSFINELVNGYRTDLGESGIRCMSPSIYQLDNAPCINTKNHTWSPFNKSRISLKPLECNCNTTLFVNCFNNQSGNPQTSNRIMASTDILHDLTEYNITDFIIKNHKRFRGKLFGGFQFIFPSYIGEIMFTISQTPLWFGIAKVTDNNTKFDKPSFLSLLYFAIAYSGKKKSYSKIWVNTKGYISMPAYVNIQSNLVLRSMLDQSKNLSEYGIVVESHPFRSIDLDLFNEINKILFLQVTLAVFVMVGLSFIPASFVIFLIEERVGGAKQQQYISGINPLIYWFTNFFWDLIKYILSVCLFLFLFAIFKYYSLIGLKNIGALLLLFIFYGLAIIPHMYQISFLISTPSTAFVLLYIYNLSVGCVTTLITFFIDKLLKSNINLKTINYFLKKIFLIFPQYNLGRGLMDLTSQYLEYDISDGKIGYDPLERSTTGEKLCFLVILSLFWWGVILSMESKVITRVLQGKLAKYKFFKRFFSVKETQKWKHQIVNKNYSVLKIVNLSQSYKSNYLGGDRQIVLNNICIDVKNGECFGLLGINGTGKTTIMKMLIGEIDINHGMAFIDDFSVVNHISNVHKSIGVCPQFDTIHSLLSCNELLYFYCRIRGVSNSNLRQTVAQILKSLNLMNDRYKLTNTLSGGMKRKLSLAISLIGFPKLLLLDDPTSCMDPLSKRTVWNLIQNITNNGERSILLSSNDMKECEILCHKVGIMINGEIMCFGTVKELKSKFTSQYHVKLKLHSLRNQRRNRDKIKSNMYKTFSHNFTFESEDFVSMLFKFNSLPVKFSQLFQFFEKQKDLGYISSYSISEISLDKIFEYYNDGKHFPKVDKKFEN